MMMLLLVFCLPLTILLLLLTIVYWKLIRPEKRIYDIFRAQGIPGEPFIPLIGQLPQLARYRNADKMMVFYEDLIAKHGHICLQSYGPSVRLFVNDPEILADVLSRNNANYYAKPPLTSTVFKPIIGEHNLLVAEGDEHERGRRMINPAFHHTNLKTMISIISDRTIKTIESLLARSDHEQEVDLQVVFNSLTLSVIVSSAFGADLEVNVHAKDVMCRVLAEVVDAVIYRSLRMVNQIPLLAKLPFWKRDVVDKGGRLIAEFVDQVIADRRQGRSGSMSDGPDLLDLLLSAVDNEGQPFSDREIKDQALTFVFAGSETTGNLMVWMFYVLMTHDEVFQACREEVDRILPNGTVCTNDHLPELIICEAVISETLRLYPSAPIFVRHCIHEHTIGSERKIRVPVGADIHINSHTMHRRSDLWPRPLEFDYTRWLRDPKTGLKAKLAHPFAYLPFAAGPRNCIGQNFALLEAKIMLAMSVQRCDFKLVPGQKIVPDVKVTLKTRYGLLANVSKREK